MAAVNFLQKQQKQRDVCWRRLPLGRLEPDISWREAELGAAKHGGSALGIVADMGAHRMDIAPGPLDRIIEKYAAAAARLHQAVDGTHAPIDGLGGIPAVACSAGQGDLFVG